MGAIIDKIKGTAMRIEGALTGDKVRMVQGTVKKAKGDLEGAASRVVRKVKSVAGDAKARLGRAGRRARVR